MTVKTKEKKLLSGYKLIIIFLMVMFITACAAGVKRYIRPDFDIGGITKVAVLTLENLTSEKYASEKIKNIIIMELLTRGIDVIEPGEVIRALKEMKIRNSGSVSSDDIKRLGRLLNVDAVIMGSVETYSISKGITVSYPEVSVNLRMHESANSNIVWSVWHTTGGASFWTRHFGTEGRTLDEAAKRVIRDAFDTLFRS